MVTRRNDVVALLGGDTQGKCRHDRATERRVKRVPSSLAKCARVVTALREFLVDAVRRNEQSIRARFERVHAPNPDEYWIHKATFSEALLE